VSRHGLRRAGSLVRVKAFVSPRWIGLHALLLASLVVLGRIGMWQWDKARDQDDWQNYGYAVQWWLFAGFAVFLWVKLVLDELDPERVRPRDEQEPEQAQPAARPAASAEDEDEDPELAAYNAHLRRLAEQQ
jgi:DNA-binding transcriptional regulator of glucitol operon